MRYAVKSGKQEMAIELKDRKIMRYKLRCLLPILDKLIYMTMDEEVLHLPYPYLSACREIGSEHGIGCDEVLGYEDLAHCNH